jgi:hypothetical protein
MQIIEDGDVGRSETDVNDPYFLFGEIRVGNFAIIIHQKIKKTAEWLWHHKDFSDEDLPVDHRAVMTVEGDFVLTC